MALTRKQQKAMFAKKGKNITHNSDVHVKVKPENKKRERDEIKKLRLEKIEPDWLEDSVTGSEGEFVSGFTTKFQDIDMEVFPVHGSGGGWEYRLQSDTGKLSKTQGQIYESLFESFTGREGDHAQSSDQAMEWAENTARDFINER